MSPLRFSYKKGERIIQEESQNGEAFSLPSHAAVRLFDTSRTTLFRLSPPEVQPKIGLKRVYTDKSLLDIAVNNSQLGTHILEDPDNGNVILQNRKRTVTALLDIPFTEASNAILNSRK